MLLVIERPVEGKLVIEGRTAVAAGDTAFLLKVIEIVADGNGRDLIALGEIGHLSLAMLLDKFEDFCSALGC